MLFHTLHLSEVARSVSTRTHLSCALPPPYATAINRVSNLVPPFFACSHVIASRGTQRGGGRVSLAAYAQIIARNCRLMPLIQCLIHRKRNLIPGAFLEHHHFRYLMVVKSGKVPQSQDYKRRGRGALTFSLPASTLLVKAL